MASAADAGPVRVAVAGAGAATLRIDDGLDPANTTSMPEDRRAGRLTEHDLISGAVVRAASRHALDAPLNRAMLALLGAAG